MSREYRTGLSTVENRRYHSLRIGGPRSMHYERAPRFRRWKLDVAPPPLRCAVQGLRSAAAALGEGTGVVCPAKKLQQGLGKMAGEWHFTLGGKQALARMTFPPRRQLK